MQKKEEVVNIVTTIAEYSTTAGELAKLKAKLAGAKYEVTTTAGMDTAKKDRRELVTLRTSLESKRKEIKAPALERCKQIDEEAKRITAELLALEQPIDAQIKAEEARKEAIAEEKRRIEAERVAAIRTRISQFPNLVRAALAFDSTAITEHIAKIEAKQLSAADYAELLPEAETAKLQVVADLREMLTARVEQEEATAKAEAERKDAARVEALRGRLRVIQDWPRGCIGLTSEQIEICYDGFFNDPPRDFEELEDEADLAFADSLAEIKKMYDAAKSAEADAAQLKKDQEELADLREKKRIQDEADQKERDRVSQAKEDIGKIRLWPANAVGKNAETLRQMIKNCELVPIGVEYQEFENEAEQARCESLGRLREMLAFAEESGAESRRLETQRTEQEAAQKKLDDDRLAEEKRRAEKESAKIKPLASGYSIVIKNAGKGRFVGLWLNEKDVEQHRTGKAHETEEECLAMVKSFISGEGRV